ncbi:MAG TPA: type II toxin-antitoxin system death-on-curing family toxin, partial [bacterium]|nr:type II toxin-antitoxin system death-on-curing family toxin [bacterium]
RTAFVAAATFLLLNGWEITASEKAVVETFLRLAAGGMTEEQLAAWYEKNTAPPEQQDTDMNPWPR